MNKPFLIAETPRGGHFGHRFLIPSEPALRSTDVEAYFQRAALGRGNDFIAVSRQVQQHLHNVVREGAETLLLAGLEGRELGDAQLKRLRQLLKQLLPKLEKLVTEGIDWEASGERTLVIRDELGDWLRQDLADSLAIPALAFNNHNLQASTGPPRKAYTPLLIGTLLGLAVGLLTLFLWLF